MKTKFIAWFLIFSIPTLGLSQAILNFNLPTPSLGGGVKPIYVYLPNGYDENDHSTKHRVFIFLHGAGLASSANLLASTVSPAAQRLVSNGQIDPPILIFPELATTVEPAYGNLHLYSNSEYYGNYEDVIAKDLIEWLRNESTANLNKKTIPKRKFLAIGGFSMGGDGAIRIGVKYPDLFGGVAAHGCTPSIDGFVFESPFVEFILNQSTKSGSNYIYRPEGIVTELFGYSAAWNELDQSGKIQLLLDPSGIIIGSVVEAWKKNADLRRLILNRGTYSETEGPFIYLQSGEQDQISKASSSFLIEKQWRGFPEDVIEYEITPNAGHGISRDIAERAIKWLSDQMDAIITSQSQSDLNKYFLIYPNLIRTSESINLRLDLNRARSVMFRIYDSAGELFNEIKFDNLYTGMTNLQVQSPSNPGVYFYQIITDSGKKTEKIIVLH